jgi:hypothetical protein
MDPEQILRIVRAIAGAGDEVVDPPDPPTDADREVARVEDGGVRRFERALEPAERVVLEVAVVRNALSDRRVRSSSNARTPNRSVSTFAAAAEATEWPEVYSGNAGVPISDDHVGSM